MRKITEIFIHHSDTPDSREVSVKDIDAWHKKRGFNKSGTHRMCCGYHYVIRRDGMIEVGRMVSDTGAHAANHNSKSIGICMVGRFKYTDGQWKSLRFLLIELKTRFTKARIRGHNEVSAKSCPGFDVQIELLNGKLKGVNHG